MNVARELKAVARLLKADFISSRLFVVKSDGNGTLTWEYNLPNVIDFPSLVRNVKAMEKIAKKEAKAIKGKAKIAHMTTGIMTNKTPMRVTTFVGITKPDEGFPERAQAKGFKNAL